MNTSSHDSWAMCLMTAQASVSALTGAMCAWTQRAVVIAVLLHTVLLTRGDFSSSSSIEYVPLNAVCHTSGPHFNNKCDIICVLVTNTVQSRAKLVALTVKPCEKNKKTLG